MTSGEPFIPDILKICQLKQFGEKEWPKVPPKHCADLIYSYGKSLLEVIAVVVQPLIKTQFHLLLPPSLCMFSGYVQ